MDNKLVFTQTRKVSSAFIDSTAKMGIAQAVLMVQDNLTECFGNMETDNFVFKERYNSFWVFTKTKLHFERRPDWCEEFTASTFPVDNAGFRANVNSIFTDKNGKVLLSANQECCCLDFEKHRPVKLSTTNFPGEGFPEPVFSGGFEKITEDLTEDDFVYEQVIHSQHIDMSKHMNNIEYVKLGLNVFSVDFIETHAVKDLEVHYSGESKENQILRIYKKEVDNRFIIKIKESDRCVFEMIISFN